MNSKCFLFLSDSQELSLIVTLSRLLVLNYGITLIERPFMEFYKLIVTDIYWNCRWCI